MANSVMEKMDFYGVESMTDLEILQIMLSRQTKAADFLAGTNLTGLMQTPIAELEAMGMTRLEARRVGCLAEILRRSQRAPERTKITSPRTAASYLMPKTIGLTEEVFGILALNAKAEIIGERTISMGTSTGTLISPREFLRAALGMGATTALAWHNHPSGSVEPSAEDCALTRRLRGACDSVGITLADHIIVSPSAYHSFRAAEAWDRL